MKLTNFPVWSVVALGLAGCQAAPQTSSSDFESLVQQDPDVHLGQFVAGWGPVSSIHEGDGHDTTFQVSDRGVSFVVNYPNLIPELEDKVPVWFLGRVSGAAIATDRQGRPVRAIRVYAIEVKNSHLRRYLTSELEYTQAWDKNMLSLR